MAVALEIVMRLGLEMVHRTRLDRLASRVLPREGVIFALHRVLPAVDRPFAPNRLLEVTPEFLEDTIRSVRAHGFDIVSLDDALVSLEAGSKRPFACFTFDDAYRDNLDYALPVLEKHGVPFTIYVPEQFADGTGQLWWVELELAIAACDTIAVPELFADERLACSTVNEKDKTYQRIYWRLRQMDEGQARSLVRGLCSRAGVDVSRVCRELIMPWNALRDMSKSKLASFGAHTVRHYALAKLHPAEALDEIVRSKVRVESELDRPCRHFCYPYGDTGSAGPRDYELAHKCGFASAVTMRKGLIEVHHRNHMMSLPRCSLNGQYQNQRYVSALLSGLPFFLWNGIMRRQGATGLQDASATGQVSLRAVEAHQ